MIGKSTLESYPERRSRADHPLKQVNVNSFSSSASYMNEIYNSNIQMIPSIPSISLSIRPG
jgi:hypothetical protein